MKTFVAAFLIVLSFNSFASNDSKPPISDLVKQEIMRSELNKTFQADALVLVSFKVDENGQIIIQESNTDNDAICAQVMQILHKMVLPVSNALDEVYQLKFVFRWI